jgi:hypothetical protein
MTFADQLRDSINSERELSRVTRLFQQRPNRTIETTLSYQQCKELGFVVSDSFQGTYISLPEEHYGR